MLPGFLFVTLSGLVAAVFWMSRNVGGGGEGGTKDPSKKNNKVVNHIT